MSDDDGLFLFWDPSLEDLKLAAMFAILFIIVNLVVFQVNNYKIEGVYGGETENGHLIGDAVVESPADSLFDEVEKGEYIVFHAYGWRYRVVVRGGAVPVGSGSEVDDDPLDNF